MNLRTKLGLGFLSMAILVGFSSALSLLNDQELREDVDGLVHANIEELAASSEVAYRVQWIKSGLREMMLENIVVPHKGEVELARQQVEEGLAVLEQTGSRWEATIQADLSQFEVGSDELEEENEELERVRHLLKMLNEFIAASHVFLDLHVAAPALAEKHHQYFDGELEPQSRRLQEVIEEIREKTLVEARREGTVLDELLVENEEIAVATTVLVTFLACLLGIFFYFRIILPLQRLREAAIRVDEGDFEERVPVSSKDELGTLAASFNKMVESIQNSVRELNFQKTVLDEHAIVSIADVRGNITYVNDKFCEISGYSREELLGRNHRII